MNSELFTALDILEKEKGISKQYMLERIEAALLSAYKREYGGINNVRVAVNPQKKDIKIYQQRTVVAELTDEYDEFTQILLPEAKKLSRKNEVGCMVEVEMKPKNFRRLSAQTAKQVIIQGIREEERKMVQTEYENKREEIVSAVVTMTDAYKGIVVVDTGTSEAVLTKNEQIPGEELRVGDKIKVFVCEVLKESKGPVVVLSRAHAGLIKRLLELEIPEVKEGVVLIRGICREAGSRTKVAVSSRDEDVDPIGACIGNHGARIAAVLNEIGGEKIDVVAFSEDPAEYIRAALSPATVNSVFVDDERCASVYVNPDQLSLAIGKEGQNARLAAKLTGYRIDIKGEV